MLDHITFGVGDLDRMIAFYDSALAPLGVKRLLHVTAKQSGGGAFAGYGEAARCTWRSREGVCDRAACVITNQ